MKGTRNWALGLFGLGLIAFSLHPASASSQAAAGTQTPMVVAARAIAQGTVLTSNDLRVTFEMQSPAGAFTRPGSLLGKTAAVNIGPGRVIDDAVIATASVNAQQSVAIHLDAHSIAAVASGDVVEVVGVDPSTNAAQIIAGNAIVEDVTSGSSGFDVTISCASSCIIAVVGAQLQSHPLALVRVTGRQ
jgi:hypothetical protein